MTLKDNMTTTFNAHGKLLLTGEYFVLDGALALALPCKLGQSMSIQPFESHDSVLKYFFNEKGCKLWPIRTSPLIISLKPSFQSPI